MVCYGALISYFCFCFKQKTAYEMRISDWSSDVCSSDLEHARIGVEQRRVHPRRRGIRTRAEVDVDDRFVGIPAEEQRHLTGIFGLEIGRASCRERVCQYV